MAEQILIDAQTLHQGLSNTDWIAVDCRSELADHAAGRRSYDQGHLPGAVFLDLDRDLSGPVLPGTGRHPLPDADRICATLGEVGIGNTDTVVVYDAGNGSLAARGWWILRWLGMTSVYLLNGGYARWQALGLPVDVSAVQREKKAFQGNANHSLVLTTKELSTNGPNDQDRFLVDARDRSRYRGEDEPIDPVAGHVPGAVNAPFADFVSKDGTWLPLAERAALMEAAIGTSREANWSVMCGSGVTACHLAISGLEAGFREPRLYVGSWSEWIRDPERQIGRAES